MTVFLIAAILVLILLTYVAGIERRVRRSQSSIAASRHLVTVELERRHVQLEPFLAAVEASGLDPVAVRQLVGARSWAKAVRDKNFGLPAQAAAENALSAAVHTVLSEADSQPTLKSNWAFQGPARDLDITEKRIAGAVRVYNDNADTLESLRTSFATSFIAKILNVATLDPFVEHRAISAGEPSEDVSA